MKTSFISRKILLFAVLGVFGFASQGQAQYNNVEIDVWSDRGFDDPYCDYDEFDLYLRPGENSYVTIMVIDPDGYANIIYPVNKYHQRKLRRNRVYRLSDLLDEPLYFYDIDGRAYISVIATRRPVFLNPWLLEEVRTYRHRPYGLNAFGLGVSIGDFGFGAGFEVHWTKHVRSYGYGVFTTAIVLDLNHHRYHPKYRRRVIHRRDWERRWAYRSHEPVIVYERGKKDNRYTGKRKYDIQPDQNRKYSRKRNRNDERNVYYDRSSDNEPNVERRKSDRRIKKYDAREPETRQDNRANKKRIRNVNLRKESGQEKHKSKENDKNRKVSKRERKRTSNHKK
jgi:hypothetical protein